VSPENISKKGPIVALTALTWFAVLLQLFISVSSAVMSGRGFASGIIGFLGFFTILTNLLVCFSLTMPLIAPSSASGRFFARPEVIAGVATSILFVGLAYYFLLSRTWDPQGLQLLATVLLHYVIPVLYLFYWWLTASKDTLRFSHAVIWGAYPTAYLVYALIRGKILDSYPYTFIDAGRIGYGQTLINGVGLLLAFIAIGLILVGLSRMDRRRALSATS
jgi:hypothetical protein